MYTFAFLHYLQLLPSPQANPTQMADLVAKTYPIFLSLLKLNIGILYTNTKYIKLSINIYLPWREKISGHRSIQAAVPQ